MLDNGPPMPEHRLSRTTDPETSKAGAKIAHRRSLTYRDAVEQIMKDGVDRTDREAWDAHVARGGKLSRTAIRHGRKWHVENGDIYDTGERRKSPMGATATVWRWGTPPPDWTPPEKKDRLTVAKARDIIAELEDQVEDLSAQVEDLESQLDTDVAVCPGCFARGVTKVLSRATIEHLKKEGKSISCSGCGFYIGPSE